MGVRGTATLMSTHQQITENARGHAASKIAAGRDESPRVVTRLGSTPTYSMSNAKSFL